MHMHMYIKFCTYHIARNFRQVCHLVLLAKILSANFLSCVSDYIEHIMATLLYWQIFLQYNGIWA